MYCSESPLAVGTKQTLGLGLFARPRMKFSRARFSDPSENPPPPIATICGSIVTDGIGSSVRSQVHPLTCQMQDRVRPFRVLLQGLDSFGRRQYLELDFAAMSLAVHLFHHRQRSGSGADHKPLTLPGYLLLYRERCMPKPVTEPFGRFFLTLTDVASVEHDVILVSGSVNAD